MYRVIQKYTKLSVCMQVFSLSSLCVKRSPETVKNDKSSDYDVTKWFENLKFDFFSTAAILDFWRNVTTFGQEGDADTYGSCQSLAWLAHCIYILTEEDIYTVKLSPESHYTIQTQPPDIVLCKCINTTLTD